jgi:hypothetical protein
MSFEFEVKRLLAARNRLEIMLAAASDEDGLAGEIALEIRRDAFLRAVAALSADDKVVVTGLVIGETTQPLELYVLADGKHVAYAVVGARPDGEPFDLSFPAAEAATNSIHIDLVCGAESWHATDVVIGMA